MLEVETALVKEPENLAWSGAQVPSSPHQHSGTMGVESADTHKIYTGNSMGF